MGRPAPQTMLASAAPAGGGNLTFDARGNPNLTAADYDNPPTTPADWTGTRADYIQDYKQDNPAISGLLAGLFGGGSGATA
jgi:hypothetical protein